MGQYSKYKLYYKEEYDGEQWVPVMPLQYYGEMIEEYSTSCGYIPITPIYKWEDSDETMCDGTSLYYKSYEWVSYDNGVTWEKTSNTKAGTLIQEESTDCGYSSRTITDVSEDCEGFTKVITTTIYNQESSDSGQTWVTTSSTSSATYEYLSTDCGYVPPTPSSSGDYFTIIARSSGTLYVSCQTSNAKYSTDNGATWSEPSQRVTLNVNAGDNIKWKGETNTSIDGSWWIRSTALYDASGNIMSLLYGDNFVNQTSLIEKGSAFKNMFYSSPIVNAKYLYLPAITLSTECYYGMFENCTYLITAPELPATTLAGANIYGGYDDGCYENMFRGCSSLIQAPSILPATTLVNGCYTNMFRGCSSLVQAPQLPATTLAPYCYISMFDDCTSLTQAPELPATTLANGCYANMFYNCKSLTQAPQLQATTLAPSCYAYMFEGCKSLTQAPELPATTLASGCYYGMFYNCTSLTTPPSILPATTLVYQCYREMFRWCNSLTQAPELPATTLAEDCYAYMFNGCTSLTTAPTLPATTLVTFCYGYMFASCQKLNYIKMLATNISATQCLYNWVTGVNTQNGTFVKAASMESLPTGPSGIPRNWTVQNA